MGLESLPPLHLAKATCFRLLSLLKNLLIILFSESSLNTTYFKSLKYKRRRNYENHLDKTHFSFVHSDLRKRRSKYKCLNYCNIIY